MERKPQHLATAAVALALLAACGTEDASTETLDNAQIDCGPEGTPVDVEGVWYCGFEGPLVIEEGFECPATMETLGVFDGVAICGPPGSSDNAIDEVLERLDDPIEEPAICDARPIDLLFVVDNSGSMGEEIDELMNGFLAMMEPLVAGGHSVNSGVITTDIRSMDAERFVTEPGMYRSSEPACTATEEGIQSFCTLPHEGDPVPEDVTLVGADDQAGGLAGSWREELFCRLGVGDCGNGFEMGLESIRTHLEGVEGGDFLRDDALLAIVIVSDEDDCSSGGALVINSDSDCYIESNRERLTPVVDFVDFLIELKGSSSNVAVASIIGPDDRLPNQERGDPPIFSCISQLGGEDGTSRARAGDRYSELTRSLDGREYDICQGDWQPMLGEIGEFFVSRAQRSNCR